MTIEGTLASTALALANDNKAFSPHSAHIYYGPVLDVALDSLSWTPEVVSEGNSFVSKCVTASDDKCVRLVMNCSFVARNSYRSALEAYQQYTSIIKQRREQGKTEEDDEDDEIKPVYNPMTVQVPFPEMFKDLASMKGFTRGNIDYKVPGQIVVDFKSSSYYDVVHFAARLVDPGPNLFANLAELSGAIDVLEYNIGTYQATVLERVLFFHDDDIENGYFVFQGRIIGFEKRTLLLEFEVFNEGGVHVGTVHQTSDVRKVLKM